MHHHVSRGNGSNDMSETNIFMGMFRVFVGNQHIEFFHVGFDSWGVNILYDRLFHDFPDSRPSSHAMQEHHGICGGIGNRVIVVLSHISISFRVCAHRCSDAEHSVVAVAE